MKKKNIAILFLSIILIGLTSCESNLDLSDPNRVTDSNFWKTEAQFKSAMTGVYPLLKNATNGYYGRTGVRLRNTRGDEFIWRSNTPDIYTLHIFTNANTNGVVQNLFYSCYAGIYRTSVILEKIESASLATDFTSEIKGQCYFLRGLFYFILANEFGDVPIRQTPSQDPNTFPIEKSSQADVYSQSISDFKQASDLLPVVTDAYRPSKGAALAFIGKAYIYIANWAKAKETLEPLTKSPYTYALVNDFEWNFDEEHENNAESIFEIPFVNLGGTNVFSDGESTSSSQAAPIGIDYAAAAVGGWFNTTVQPAALDTLLKEKDKDGNVDYRTRMTVAWNYPGCVYYMKPFQEVFSGANSAEGNSIWLLKYQNWKTRTFEDASARSYINDRAFRYANVIMFLAEAENELGNSSAAIGYINQIRMRANLTPYVGATSKGAIKNEIIHQRYVEFFKEGERFYDLRRWGLLEEAIKKADPIRGANIQKKHEYLPIPAKELQTNSLCKQNPLWE